MQYWRQKSEVDQLMPIDNMLVSFELFIKIMKRVIFSS